MELKRDYQRESLNSKGKNFEYYSARFNAGSIQVNNNSKEGGWVYVLFLNTRKDCDNEYPTKEIAYAAALARVREHLETSLQQIKQTQEGMVRKVYP